MTLVQFFRLIGRYFYLMLLCAVLPAVAAYYGTRNEKKEYQSFSIINTGLVTGYNIENSQGGRIDYGYTNNEIENILSLFRSRETRGLLALQLLTQAVMLEKANPEVLSQASFQELQRLIPASVRQTLVVPGDTLGTLANLKQALEKHEENPVKALIESKHSLFGLEYLQNIVVKREGNTDMIRIAYTTTDPAVCRNTLQLLTNIAIQKHRFTKEGQSTSVLDFFENATRESANALSGKEDAMLNFMVGNKIINYYEQTRFIAAKKEDLDEMYFKELMTLAAADSSRRNLEIKLENRISLPEVNRALLIQKEQLSGVSARLASLEIGSVMDSLEDVRVKKEGNSTAINLQNQADLLKKSIRKSTEAMFAVNRTPDGLETKNLLTHWLEEWLDVEQTLARLDVLRDRKLEFDQIYSRFAPWGSKLKRIEREIDVAERAYLENLHSYNQARLHKYNMLMSTNLRVVDPPFFPEMAESSKRILMVILAGIAGFVLVLATVIALEFLDNTLRDPERAAATTKLALTTAFPMLPKNWQNASTFDYAFIMQRASGQLLQHLKLLLREKQVQKRPARIGLMSTREGEGKTELAAVTIGQLRAAGERVLWLRPQTSASVKSHSDDHFFKVDHTFFEKKTEADLLGEAFDGADLQAFDYVFAEIPAILANTYPADYLASMDVSFFFARANRTWNRADSRALDTLHRVLGSPCNLVLNMVRPDDLESAIGEVPKHRSPIRRWLKKLATLNFAR